MKNETHDSDTPKTQEQPISDTQSSSQLEEARHEVPVTSGEARLAQPADKPRNSKKKSVVIVAMVLLIIALAAVFYFLLAHKTPQSNKDADPLAAASKFESPQALVDAIEPEFKGSVFTAQSTTGVSAVDSDGIYAYGAPVYKVDGAKFSVLPLTISGFAYKSSAAVAEDNYVALKSFFEQNKFVKKYAAANEPGTVSDTGEAVNYIAYAEYESRDLLCAIRHADATPTKAKAHIVGIGCANKESYSQASQKLQPFYKAYTASGDIYSDNLVFGFLRESTGANGYKYATIYQEDDKQFSVGEEAKSLTGLYYQMPNKSEWTYFTINTVNSLPYCASYNSDVLKQAFKGYKCFDEATQNYLAV